MRLITNQAGAKFFSILLDLGKPLLQNLNASAHSATAVLNSQNTLFVPFLAGLVSCAVLLVQSILTTKRKPRESVLCEATIHIVKSEGRTSSGRFAKLSKFVDEHGGLLILICKVERLLGSAGLLGLSLHDFVNKGISRDFVGEVSLELGLVVTYWYATILSTLALIPNTWSQTFIQHTNFVLFAAFATYIYRDIWPLATFTEQPLDLIGLTLYAKMSILTLTAVLIPLFVPRRYIPVDPEHPMEEPNPEQTASIFSLMVYAFVDSIIIEAYSVPHLSHEKLPPLCDSDKSKRLSTNAFPYLDPFRGAKKNRHIFWGLMRIFFWDYFIMALCLLGTEFSRLVSPIAVNRILVYLESPNPNTFIRPWFWVLALFTSPILASLLFQWYFFIGSCFRVRLHAILTELIFEHGLRIRLKAEASGELSSSAITGTPTLVAEPSSSSASTVVDSIAEGSDGESYVAKGKAKAEPATSKAPLLQPKKKANLVGKMNTLVTVDMDRILSAKDFLVVVLLVPVELMVSMTFLYVVLGWSAFVGLASIIILSPVPGYLASRMQVINTKKMTKTDARVEGITQTIGVLRMVKMFGWEKKMTEKLQQTREEELHWLFKEKAREMLYLLTSIVNFLIPTLSMLVTYASYTIIANEPLTPSKIFSSLTVFGSIRGAMRRTNWFFTDMIKGKVSLDRVGEFLCETELLDNYSEESLTEINVNFTPEGNENSVGFNNAVFAWSKDADSHGGLQTESARSFKLKLPRRVEFKQGALNLIVGPTGSGKTSMLMALLGEMHFMPSGIDSWYNLPRSQGIAYAAQESWVQNETIRDNILFGAPYDEERYQKVLHQCALEPDLMLFEAGDMTEVGERGLTLSGGQKVHMW